jgi:hypothetical protein
MPEHKADVHPKQRSYAMRMARGDTGRNFLNEFFDVVFYGVDSMLYEFGLFKDQEKSSLPLRKPLQGQEKAQPPSGSYLSRSENARSRYGNLSKARSENDPRLQEDPQPPSSPE